MTLTLENLKNNIEAAKALGQKYIGVKIQVLDSKAPEVIINSSENFDEKLDYYMKAYNDDLTFKAVNKIKIVGFTFGQTFAEIQSDLLGEALISFSDALTCLRAGCKIARKGWNGKGMHLFLADGKDLATCIFKDGKPECNDSVCMKTADGSITIGWTASQTDMLSDDWMVIEVE